MLISTNSDLIEVCLCSPVLPSLVNDMLWMCSSAHPTCFRHLSPSFPRSRWQLTNQESEGSIWPAHVYCWACWEFANSLSQLPTFKNLENSHKYPDFRLLLQSLRISVDTGLGRLNLNSSWLSDEACVLLVTSIPTGPVSSTHLPAWPWRDWICSPVLGLPPVPYPVIGISYCCKLLERWEQIIVLNSH